MNKILSLWIALTCTFAVSAQYKVVEKSASKPPKWVNSVESGSLVVSAKAKTIELAKSEILTLLKGQIISAIATHVVTETNVEKTSTNRNGMTDSKSEYSTYVKEKSANMPFIQEVTLSKARESYWEKLQDKSTKEYFYEYHILYPFSNLDLMKMVDQFNEYEQSLRNELNKLNDALAQIGTVEEIDRLISDTKVFQKQFRTEDPRYDACTQLINNCFKLYSAITMRVEQEPDDKQMIIGLYLGDRKIRTTQKPQLSSNCAAKLSCDAQGEVFKIRYDSFGCYPDDENFIDIRFRFSSQPVSKKIFITVK